MTQAQLIDDLTSDVVLIAFFGAAFFLVSYSIMAAWWRHAIGTTLVVVDAGLVLTLAPLVLHRLFGLGISDSVAFAWYYFGSLALVAGGIWWRSAVMLLVNWRGRRDRRRERRP